MSPLLDHVCGLRAALVDGPVGPRGETTDDDAARVELLSALELLKSAACAAQADLAVALDASVRARDAARGSSARRGQRGQRGHGAAGQLGLARQESPHRAQVLLGLAADLATDLPATRAALREGRLSEHRALVVARESGCLDREQRAVVDEAVCGEGGTVDGLGTRELAAEVRRRVCALDPAAVVRRHERAVADRGVSVRPAPDGMAYLSGVLPLVQAVGCYAALRKHADARRATGDPRPREQLMADALVERVTGQASADVVPVVVDMVLSDAALLGADAEPAVVPGWGPVPAQVAREVAARASDAMQAWVRRLYVDPAGSLVAMSTRQRLATDGLATFLDVRDQGVCRTPWCDAPIRHADHVVAWREGGTTDADQLQGLCEACDYTKQAPGWRQRVVSPGETGRHTVETTTPTGHRYRTPAPAPPGTHRPPPSVDRTRVDLVSPLQRRLQYVLDGDLVA